MNAEIPPNSHVIFINNNIKTVNISVNQSTIEEQKIMEPTKIIDQANPVVLTSKLDPEPLIKEDTKQHNDAEDLQDSHIRTNSRSRSKKNRGRNSSKERSHKEKRHDEERHHYNKHSKHEDSHRKRSRSSHDSRRPHQSKSRSRNRSRENERVHRRHHDKPQYENHRRTSSKHY